MLKKVYVWEFPVRLTHWLNFLSIFTLGFTGVCIGAPFIYASETYYTMAVMRYIHFIAAYVFTVSVLVRIYWWFVGNKYAKWNQFIPSTIERCKNSVDTGLFYCFLKDELPHTPGHTGLAGITYLCLIVLFLLEIVTGFALYSQSHIGAFWALTGGWLLSVLSSGTVRLIHHLIMWVIGLFVIVHVYISWHNDRIERNGLMSSIFSGFKTMDEH
ncbi:MAG: Ni/Fe-hydrogenase, b-type cytochrome subunit [Dissulfurispiraceae bacterium]